MACIKLRTKQAVEECITTYQKYSLCKFVHYNSSKTFADTGKFFKVLITVM